MTLEASGRIGPIVLKRVKWGYGRELPPGHADMLRGDGPLPDWARAYGSGDSGDGAVRGSTWRERLVRAAAAEAEAARRETAALAAMRAYEVRRMEAGDVSADEGGLRVEVGEDAAAEGVRGDEAVPALALAEERETLGEDARPRPWSVPRRMRDGHTKRRARRVRAGGQWDTLSAKDHSTIDGASGGAELVEDELGGTGSEGDDWLERAETESRRSNVGKAVQNVKRQRLRKFALQKRRESGEAGSSQEG